jgi:hypothetical protein
MPLSMGTNPMAAMMGGPPGGMPPSPGGMPMPGMAGGPMPGMMPPPSPAASLAQMVQKMAQDKDRAKQLIHALMSGIKKIVGDNTVGNPEVVTHLSRAFGPINAALKALDKSGPNSSPELSSLLGNALMGGGAGGGGQPSSPVGGLPG